MTDTPPRGPRQAEDPAADAETPDARHTDAATTPWHRDRRKLLAGVGVLAAAAVGAALVLAARPGGTSGPEPETVAVTYKVTGEGTASLTYNAGTAGEPAEQQQSVELPWSKKLEVDPESGPARVSIVLGKDGGRAQCRLAVRGEHRQRATAFGEFGRATCSAEVPGRPRQGAAAPEHSR